MITLSSVIQSFFTDRLVRERNASPHTIASYRDTLRLLLCFASQRTGKQPTKLTLEDLDATLISAFLDHLQRERGCSARTRNLRLTAIRSLFRYSALRYPEHAALIEQGARDPSQAPRPRAGHVPHRTRARRADGRPRSLNLDRPA